MTVIITMSITSAAIRKQLLVCGVFLGLLVAWYRQEVNAEGLSRLSLTVNRLFELEEDPGEESSIEGRLIGGLDFSPSGYLFTSFIPLFGAGFYVAPVIGRYKAPDAMIGAQGETYRVGFGIHNMFLFPLEQGGIVAVILFFLFLRAIKRGLNRARKEGVAATRGFATGTHAFFFAMLVMGMGGQMFWYFEGSGNLVFYIVLTFILSTTELPPPARTKPLSPIARRG
jgi:hypothetical protein